MNRTLLKITSLIIGLSPLPFFYGNLKAQEINLVTNTAQYRLKQLGDQAYSEGNFNVAVNYYLKASKLKNNLNETAIKLALTKALIADEKISEAKKIIQSLATKKSTQPQLKLWLPLYQANIALAQKLYHKALSILNEFTYENRSINFSDAKQKISYFSTSELLDFKIEFLNTYAFAAQMQEDWQLATEKYRSLFKLIATTKRDGLIYQTQKNFIYCTIKDNDLAAANAMLSLISNKKDKLSDSQYTDLQYLQLFALANTPGINYKQLAEYFNKIEKKLVLTSDPKRFEIDLFIVKKVKNDIAFQSANQPKLKELKVTLLFLHDAYKIAPSTALRKNVLKQLINTYVEIKDYASAITWSNLYINFYDDELNSTEIDYIKFQLASLYRLNGEIEKSATLYKELSTAKSFSNEQRNQIALNGGHLFLKLKQYNLAAELFEIISKNNNLEIRNKGLFLLARTFMLSENYLKAANLFTNLAKTSKKYHDESLLNALICYINSKNEKEMTKTFKNIMSSVSTDDIKIKSQFFYCQLPFINKDLRKAAEEYQEFANKFPNNSLAAEAQFNSAELFFKIQEYKIAKNLYQNFLKKYPKNNKIARVLYKNIYCNFFLNNLDEMNNGLNKLKKIFPTDKYTIAAIFFINNYLQETSQYNKALKNLKFIENANNITRKDKSLAGYEIANILFKQQKFDQAATKLEQLILKYSSSEIIADALFMLGNINSLEKKYLEAIKFFNQALQRRPMTEMAIKCLLRIADCYYLLELENDQLLRYHDRLKNIPETNKKGNKVENDIIVKNLKKKGVYLNSAIKHYEQLVSGKIPQLNKKITSAKVEQKIQSQALYYLGRCFELKKDNNKALVYYQTVINNYILRYDNNYIVSEKYFIKSAYAAIDILLSKHTPQAAIEAISIYKKLQHAKINIGDNYNNLIKDLQKKFKL